MTRNDARIVGCAALGAVAFAAFAVCSVGALVHGAAFVMGIEVTGDGAGIATVLAVFAGLGAGVFGAGVGAGAVFAEDEA